jgi:hypothetical protein
MVFNNMMVMINLIKFGQFVQRLLLDSFTKDIIHTERAAIKQSK